MTVQETVAAAVAGLLFGVGIIVSGAVDPARVQAFLDVRGAWDPSLGMALVGALLVAVPAFFAAGKSSSPVFAAEFRLRARSRVTWRLVFGAVLFGIGWGLVGFSPGSALAAAGTGDREVMVFVIAMLIGAVLHRFFSSARGGTGTRDMYSNYYGPRSNPVDTTTSKENYTRSER